MIKQQQPRPICTMCHKRKAAYSRLSKGGFQLWFSECSSCRKVKYNQRKGKRTLGYRKHKKTYCEFCGFIALHPCQLDVDHIDGNSRNHAIENLRTLCSNCHRLKTYNQREGLYSK